MTGISYMVDDHGNKTAVVIDLKIHGELWEDFCDHLIVAQRASEPRISIEEVEENLRSLGKLVE